MEAATAIVLLPSTEAPASIHSASFPQVRSIVVSIWHPLAGACSSHAAMPPPLPLPDPARFALFVAAGCAHILRPLVGFAERAAAAGNDYAVAAANLLALAALAGYLLVVRRVVAACAGAAGNN